VQQYALPWTIEGLDLGSEVVEIGPGYGAATAVLQNRVERLTCIEIDRRLADRLRRRSLDHKVKVLCEDATAMSLPDASFDSALCFTMLHHIGSPSLQNRLLTEVHRVLRPNGIFAGTDSINSRFFGLIHLFDTLVLVDPGTFPARLSAAGFQDVQIDLNPYAFRFRARKPPLA
jgi:SAM-dependent methyltransferase